jgi:hypothetical protein
MDAPEAKSLRSRTNMFLPLLPNALDRANPTIPAPIMITSYFFKDEFMSIDFVK